MDFDLSGDQAALQGEARRLLDRYSGPEQVRAYLASDAPFDADLWAAMVEQGWTAVAVAEDRGGLGLGWVEAAVLLEEVGRHTSPVPYAPQLLALDALADGRHGDLASALIDGSATAAVAWGVFGKEALLAVAPDYWLEEPRELLALCLRGEGRRATGGA